MKHLKKRDCIAINNEFLERDDISLSAKGMMMCIIANSDDNDRCYLDNLLESSADSKNETISYLKELQDKGLISCDLTYSKIETI